MDSLWDYLSTPGVLLFGGECAASALSSAVALCIRILTHWAGSFFDAVFRAADLQPAGLQSASEAGSLTSLAASWAPHGLYTIVACFLLRGRVFTDQGFGVGLLPTRVAHCVVGRFSLVRLIVFVIPAHFLGAIIGVSVIKAVGAGDAAALQPMGNSEDALYSRDWWTALSLETVANAALITVMHGLPTLLSLNKVPNYWAMVPALALACIGVPEKGSAFNPTLVYGLQVASSGEHTWVTQSAHIVGPLAGALLAGAFIARVLPD